MGVSSPGQAARPVRSARLASSCRRCRDRPSRRRHRSWGRGSGHPASKGRGASHSPAIIGGDNTSKGQETSHQPCSCARPSSRDLQGDEAHTARERNEKKNATAIHSECRLPRKARTPLRSLTREVIANWVGRSRAECQSSGSPAGVPVLTPHGAEGQRGGGGVTRGSPLGRGCPMPPRLELRAQEGKGQKRSQ